MGETDTDIDHYIIVVVLKNLSSIFELCINCKIYGDPHVCETFTLLYLCVYLGIQVALPIVLWGATRFCFVCV